MIDESSSTHTWAVRVPASSANLGAGFDVLGMALRRHDVLLLVRARVIWTKQTAYNEHVAGFQFEQLKTVDQETIRELITKPKASPDVRQTA